MNFFFKNQIPFFIGSIAANYTYHHYNRVKYYLSLKQLNDPNATETVDLKSLIDKSFEDNIDKFVSEVEDFIKKKPHITYKDELQYQGDYVKDKQGKLQFVGKGILRNRDGSFKMIGTFKDNFLDGPGMLKLPDGSLTKCNFVNGKMTGKGILYYGDLEYRGNIENGTPKGDGIYFFSDGYTVFSTHNDELNKDTVKMYDKEGHISYTGDFNNLKPEGYGTLYSSNGSYYIGNFEKGLRNGQGILCDKYDDIIYKGEFKNDVATNKLLVYKEPLINIALTVANGALYIWRFYR